MTYVGNVWEAQNNVAIIFLRKEKQAPPTIDHCLVNSYLSLNILWVCHIRIVFENVLQDIRLCAGGRGFRLIQEDELYDRIYRYWLTPMNNSPRGAHITSVREKTLVNNRNSHNTFKQYK